MQNTPADADPVRMLIIASLELLLQDVSPDRLRAIGVEMEGIRATSAYFRLSEDIVNCARDLRILAEHRFGTWLGSLERRRGSRSPSEYANALERYRLSHGAAGRLIALSQKPAEPIIERIIERIRVLRASLSQDGAGSRDHDVRRDEEPLDPGGGFADEWHVPRELSNAVRNTLVTIDHVIEAGDISDTVLTGNVLAVVPEGAPPGSTITLFAQYNSGCVGRAILIMPTDQHGSDWQFLTNWPHCILTAGVSSTSPLGEQTAICLSSEKAVQERFWMYFEPLGSFYPGALDEDGALVP